MSKDNLIASLERLAAALEAQGFKPQFTDQFGWQGAALSASDMAAMSLQIAADIKQIEWSKADPASDQRFQEMAAKIDKIATNVAPSLHGGYMSLDAVINTLFGIEVLIRGLISKDVLQATTKSASMVGRRIQLANNQLDTAFNKIDGLEATTARILRAADAAEKLDITLEELDEAIKHASLTKEAVLKLQIAAEESVKFAVKSSEATKACEAKANEVMQKIHSVYGAATTVGLAKSFDEKAQSLNKSMGIWVIILALGLITAILVGQSRFPLILTSLSSTHDWSVVAMHMVISALSLGPSVWLAWIATKQIGQRFRLAEDYGYKASLAKAYEGYRTEAANLDPRFSAQLFAIALGRLEELPLRTIDKEVSGSPLNDLLQSPQFQEQMEKLPGFKEIIIGLLQRVLPQSAIDKWTKGNANRRMDGKGEA